MNRNAPVAQLDRALPSEGKGHTFESCRVRQHGSAWPAGLLAAVALIQHLLAGSQTAFAAEAPAPIPEKLRLLTDFFEEEVASGKLPGAVVLIQQHGRPVYLKTFGVRIALDDFGTGFSSLSYLKRFPFDKIKIDRCFVSDISEADGSSSIVQAVVNIAAALHMTTTAEGVETEAQRELLRRLGCNEMQGYLFSAPKPAAQVRLLFDAVHAKATA